MSEGSIAAHFDGLILKIMYDISIFDFFYRKLAMMIYVGSISDSPFGVIYIFNSIADGLGFAVVTYKASPNKYISAGVIQEEYRDYINR